MARIKKLRTAPSVVTTAAGEVDPALAGFGQPSESSIASAFAVVAEEKLTNAKSSRQHRSLFNKLNVGNWRMRHAANRAWDRYVEDGGDVGDIQTFMDWLIKNWPAILEMIKSIVALFTVVCLLLSMMLPNWLLAA
jgi:hypothetical protein